MDAVRKNALHWLASKRGVSLEELELSIRLNQKTRNVFDEESLLRPMLLKRMPVNFDPAQIAGGVAVEPKLNGHRQIIEVTKDGSLIAWSRDQKNTLHKMNRELKIQVSQWEPGIYDGELHLGFGTNYEDVQMNKNRTRLGYTAFDRLKDKEGRDITHLPWIKRRFLLQEATRGLIQSRATIIPVHVVGTRHELKRYAERIWSRKGEGLVVKLPNRIYEVGKRTDYFMKLKRWESEPIDLNICF